MQDIIIDSIEDKQILVYDSGVKAWVNTNYKNLIEEFVGATEGSDGVAGLVPTPEAGKLNHFLRSDGEWIEINLEDVNSTNYSGEYPIVINENGVISLLVDNTTLGIIDNSLSIVGFQDAALNAVLTKTENGLEWIVPEDSKEDELVEAIETVITNITNLESTVGKAAVYDENGELVTEATGLIADIAKLDSDVSNINSEISTLDTNLNAVNDTVNSLNERIEEVDNDRFELEKTVIQIGG